MYSEVSEDDSQRENKDEIVESTIMQPESEPTKEAPAEASHQSLDDKTANIEPHLAVEEELETHTLVPNEILIEYNNTVERMESEIKAYEKEQEGLCKNVFCLTEENKKLKADLNATSTTQKNRNEEESIIIQNLQEKLRSAEEARDSAIQMWRNAMEEISQHEKFVKGNHDEKEFSVLEAKVSQMQEEYVRALSVLQTKFEETNNELRKIREQHNKTTQELKDCKKLCNDFQQQLKDKDSDNNMLQKKYHDSQTKLLEKESELTECQNKLALQEKAELQLRSKIVDLEQLNSELQKQNAELALQESKITQQAKESIWLAEDAVLQKEEAIFKEQQAIKEAERLQQLLNHFAENAAQRVKQEVDNIKKKCNENIKQLMNEMHSLEMDNNEKQAQYDRVLKEKQAAEAELESLYNEGLHKGPQNSPLSEDLMKQLTNTEQVSVQAKLKVQSLQVELVTTKTSHQQEIAVYRAEKHILHDCLDRLQEEFKETCLEKMKLTEKIKQVQLLVKEKEEDGFLLGRQLKKEIQMLQEIIQRQEEKYKLQLRNMNETYQSSISELQKLLVTEKQMSEKWSSEAHLLADKFEKEMREIYKELSQMQQSNEELSIELEKCQAKNIFNEQQYKIKISQLQQQLKRMQTPHV